MVGGRKEKKREKNEQPVSLVTRANTRPKGVDWYSAMGDEHAQTEREGRACQQNIHSAKKERFFSFQGASSFFGQKKVRARLFFHPSLNDKKCEKMVVVSIGCV